MGLDVYLTVNESIPRTGSGIFVRRRGSIVEITREEWDECNPGHEPSIAESAPTTNCMYSRNITHNLSDMANAAGIFKALWYPGDLGIIHAKQLIEPLTTGLAKLKGNPALYKHHNPDNGWGDYNGLVKFVEEYLWACQEYPEAEVSVGR